MARFEDGSVPLEGYERRSDHEAATRPPRMKDFCLRKVTPRETSSEMGITAPHFHRHVEQTTVERASFHRSSRHAHPREQLPHGRDARTPRVGGIESELKNLPFLPAAVLLLQCSQRAPTQDFRVRAPRPHDCWRWCQEVAGRYLILCCSASQMRQPEARSAKALTGADRR